MKTNLNLKKLVALCFAPLTFLTAAIPFILTSCESGNKDTGQGNDIDQGNGNDQGGNDQGGNDQGGNDQGGNDDQSPTIKFSELITLNTKVKAIGDRIDLLIESATRTSVSEANQIKTYILKTLGDIKAIPEFADDYSNDYEEVSNLYSSIDSITISQAVTDSQINELKDAALAIPDFIDHADSAIDEYSAKSKLDLYQKIDAFRT
jgi:hypothetical protein